MKSEIETSRFDWDDHFFGTATVGERGQLVIPADARKRFDIAPGDKMLILSAPGKNGLMLCKLSAMREFMAAFGDALARVEADTDSDRLDAANDLEE